MKARKLAADREEREMALSLSLQGHQSWDPAKPWAEHDTPFVDPMVPPVVVVEPPPVVVPVVCAAVGYEEGQSTTCFLVPGHKFKNGNRSPHAGRVQVTRTWPNTGG